MKPSAMSPIVDPKDYDIPEKTIHYIQINHVIEKPKTKNTDAEENLRKSEVDFMTYLKTLTHKTSVDPKLLQLKICVRNEQKKRAHNKFFPVFNGITE